jgi:hypothetical protein
MSQIPDDIDLLFDRAGTVEPPDDFLGRLMLVVGSDLAPAEHLRRQFQVSASVCVLALLALALLAYQLGSAAGNSGLNVLLRTLSANIELLTDAPGAYAVALLASIPWLNFAAVGLDLAILILAVRLLSLSLGTSLRRANPAIGS